MSVPNIVLIVSDDHGYADRGSLGIHPDVRTPALDRLAREGVTFTDGYVTAPICSPSRAGIMTGLYQQRWGGLWFDSARFPDDESVATLAEVLGGAGYRTGYFGKVHYGGESVGDRACPPHHGFETTLYGLAGQSLGRLNYLHHSRAAQSDYGPEAAKVMGVQPLLAGDDPVELEGFLTEELGARARSFIAADDDRPFFCMVAFNAVHNFCWQLPPEELERRNLPSYDDWNPAVGTSYGDWYDDAIVPNLPHGREYYLAQLELMDREIGRILAQLDDLGTAEDTLFIYLTDNGGSTCNFGDNTPLRGTKYTLWEGGIRVPMLWRWPGTLTASSCSTPVSSVDLMATFRALVCADDGQPSDGVDLLPVVRGAAAVQRALHWECGFQFAVRDGDWKLSWVEPGNPAVAHLRAYEHAALGEGWHLADLASDPGEERNLIEAHPEIAARLLKIHEDWLTEIGLDTVGQRTLPAC